MASAAADGLNPIEVLKEIHSAVPVKGKRRHHHCCKSYGKIGFTSLAKMIAKKWNGLSAATKASFEVMATEDKKLYEQKVKEWKNKQAEKYKYDANKLNTMA
eukprot:15339850-Ditylum_brightwellii.AAC.1